MPIDETRKKVADRLRAFGRHRGVAYTLSLPERVLRSASALSAGLVREFAGVALPIGVRRGRLYQNLVDASLRFLIEDIGQVEGAYPVEQALADGYLVRRAVGNGIEVVGLVAFHASPVWVLAALADITGAGRQLIPRIAEELKAEGLLDSKASFENMDQLLAGLESTSGQLAETVNTPPLDVAGLRTEWSKLVAEAKRIPTPKLPKASDLTGLWSELNATAAAQNRSVFETSSVLALSAVGELPKRARVLSRSAVIVVRHGGGAFSDALLDHYRETLGEIRKVGYTDYATRQLTPYVKSALDLFSPQRSTATERFLGGATTTAPEPPPTGDPAGGPPALKEPQD